MSSTDAAKKKKAEEKKERIRLEREKKKLGNKANESSATTAQAKPISNVADSKKEGNKKTTKTDDVAKSKQIVREEEDDDVQSSEDEDSELEPNVFAALEEDANKEEADVSAWADIDLSSETMSALSKLGFTTPTLIQESAIPEILDGHDVVGKASTGSGKTLAFCIPIVEKWLELRSSMPEEEGHGEGKSMIALILSPTRELAHQLNDHFTALCSGLSTAPYIATVTGGLSVQKQQRQLARADIVIGTPGRLWEVMSSNIEMTKAFRQIKFLVVDEADRLLTEGHFKEATEILGALDRQVDAEEGAEVTPDRQTLIFSATFNKGLQQKLAGKGKHGLADKADSMEYLLQKLNFREEKPKFIDVNPVSQMAEGLKEGMIECAGTEKVTLFTDTTSSSF